MHYKELVEKKKEIRELKKELEVTDKLLESRERLLKEVPECELHGNQCVSHAVEWVKKMKKIEKMFRIPSMINN